MTKTNARYASFFLVHNLSRRIRCIIPGLIKDFERTYVLAILLRKHEGILSVRAVPEIASVVVYFDPGVLPKSDLLILLGKLAGNLGKQSKASPRLALTAKPNEDFNHQPLRDFNLSIEGMTCPSCALLIEVRLRRDPRIASAAINFATETAIVRGKIGKEALFAQIGGMGYRASSLDTLTQRRLLVAREKVRLAKSRNRAIWSNLLNLPAIYIAFAAPPGRWLYWLEFGFTVHVSLWSGWPFFTKAWSLFAKHRSASMDTLITLGVGLAYSQGLFGLLARRRTQYFQAAGGIISFVLLGRYLEDRAKAKSHAAIRRLIDGQPQTATVLRDGQEFSMSIDDIKVGDVFLVRPGERIPTDGIVLDGLSKADESLVTGESMPVIKDVGSKLIGGCVNGSGALKAKATAIGTDTVLAGIIHTVDLAQNSKLPIQSQVDRVTAVFMPAVMGVSAMTFLGWLAAGAGPERALTHAISVMLVACPCALGMATPAATMVGTGEAARRGIFVRNGESLETATKLTVVVFDKTGTLTEGKPQVTDVIDISGEADGRMLSLAAAAESSAGHPLGNALIAKARQENLPIPEAERFENVPGHGIGAWVEGQPILIGNRRWLEAKNVDMGPLTNSANDLGMQGKTPVFLAVNGKLAALFGIADRPRTNARQAIANLHKLNVKTLMVTGDTLATAEQIAQQVGIDTVIANASPEQKLEIIRELQLQGGLVGMIGDGINDAPALAAADVGFALSSGTDLAMASADMNLARGDIAKVAEAMALGKVTLRVVRQNLVWAAGYNSLFIPLAAFGKLGPLSASIAMSVSSLALILNALRLQKK
ncbi:MAG: heavy metal translocating P-type ATPase [Proteobacteria bacterium]|nr:heavy metal translocating P-type ATPase [Pseudomonadota bacterium]